ncbi:hypothetical protein EYF80_047259 [Liparis tanakae]|uniref:Uncharacterized protein n=1 Tax=Liparis tanakae TaxID=230148 RepID=A0A4Z2FP28_9TELE|nr:hypothetical protein EYF80_047259 [Liparis tanakae]
MRPTCSVEPSGFLASRRRLSSGCVAPSRTSNVSLHSLLSRRLAAGTVAVETRVAVMDEDGLETVAEITRLFVVEEEEEEEGGGGRGGASLSA